MQLTLEMPLSKTCQDGLAVPTTHSAVSWLDLSARMMPYHHQRTQAENGESGLTQVWSLDPKDVRPGVFLTLNISDWPNDASVSSLSQILETGPIPQRFYLSALACRGILRRAEKRGKELPEQLRVALEAVADS